MRADAPGAPGNRTIGQGGSRWPEAFQLWGRWRYQHLGTGERRASAYTTAGTAPQAPSDTAGGRGLTTSPQTAVAASWATTAPPSPTFLPRCLNDSAKNN